MCGRVKIESQVSLPKYSMFWPLQDDLSMSLWVNASHSHPPPPSQNSSSKQFVWLNYFPWIFQYARSYLAAIKYYYNKGHCFLVKLLLSSWTIKNPLYKVSWFASNGTFSPYYQHLAKESGSSVILDRALTLNFWAVLLPHTYAFPHLGNDFTLSSSFSLSYW